MYPASQPLGRRIKALRETRGWTQADLATNCLLSSVYVQTIELGERELTLPPLKRMARVLGATLVLGLRPPRRTPPRKE